MENKACAHQFTGGRDSTLAALILAEEYGFNEIHLLTFKTDLTADLHKVNTNVDKLRKYFGNKVKVYHEIIDTQDLHRDLVQKKYLKNLISYRTYNAATFCPSCRISHHVHTIVYCLQNNISVGADGVNELTGFDLFQQKWAVAEIEKLYKSFGVKYFTPILDYKVSSERVLEEYNISNKFDEPFYESQPRCLGGGQFHNLYLRCYYLPLKGKQAYIDISKKWISEKIQMAIDHVHSHVNG